MPKKRDRRSDSFGFITKMAEADGWVMVRRSRAVPFVISLKEWNDLAGQPTEAIQEQQGFVYFIDAGNCIKIGYSADLQSRLAGMKTDSSTKIAILHTEPGTFRTEKVLHRYFDSIRLHGEWFRKTPELLAYIEQRKAL